MLQPVREEPNTTDNNDDDDANQDDGGQPEDPRLKPPVVQVQTNLDEDSQRLVRKYQDMARALVEQSVHIIVEPKEDLNVRGVLRRGWHPTCIFA